MKLEGASAIVTGGGRGIGRAISLALAAEGCDVAIVVKRDQRNAEKTANDILRSGRQARAFLADISDKDSVDGFVDDVVSLFGKVDLLVNNASVLTVARLEDVSVEDWDNTLAVNLRGVFLCSVAVARDMMKRSCGNIINIIGASAHRCLPGVAAFGPSKAAVINLTRQMAVEWSRHNIRVNAVSPGPISTQETLERQKNEEDLRRRIAKLPIGRLGEPEEVASVVTFLASGESRYITGQSLIVDGGGSCIPGISMSSLP